MSDQTATKRRKRIVRPNARRVAFRRFYLHMTNDARYDFCKAAGTTQGYIHQIYGGWTLGSVFIAQRIEEASNGKIPAWYLRPDVFAKPADAAVLR